jgi:capsular exopolysaccharide synthesis family protein
MTNPVPPHFEEDSIDFRKYIYMIFANWYWFLISVSIGVGVAWMVNRYTMPVYQVGSSLMINEDSRGRGLTGYENMIPGIESFRSQKTLLSEMEILKSSVLTERALGDLNFNITYIGVGRTGFKEALLYNSSPFTVLTDSTDNNLYDYPVYIQILNEKEYELSIDGQYNISEVVPFGKKFSSASFNFTIVPVDSIKFTPDFGYSKYYFQFNSTNTLVNDFKALLTINTNDSRRGSILFLTMTGNSPQQVTDYLNTLMRIYIIKGLEEKNQTALNTVNFIDQQLSILDTTLKGAEKNLQDFRLKNRLIDVSSEGSVIFSRLTELQNSRSLAELQTRYLNYLREYVNDRNNTNQIVVPATVDLADGLLSSLIGQLNTLLAEKSELQFTVQGNNPTISQIDSKIDYTREAVLDNIKNIFKNNSINLEEIDRQLVLAEKEFDKLPATERRFISIQREYKVNDQIYTYWLQKRAEAAIAKAANVADNKILDYAKVENAILISPKARSNNLMGLVLGLAFPLALLILLDLTNTRITGIQQIERKTTVPIISTVGHNDNAGEIPVFERPKSALSESFRGLRTNLQYMLREKNQKVVMITSTISGEGKTFCSTNLAAIFAMAGKKTLLIGLDLRKPKVHKVFNLEGNIGVSTCMIGKTTLTEATQSTKIENLFVLPAGPVPPNPAELLESQTMSDLIKEAREIYDIIILDTPPYGMVTDSRLISRLADLNLFVLRQNYSTLNILSLIEETHQKNEIGQMGLIVNDIHVKGYYGYGYRYYNYGTEYRYGYYNTYGDYNEA